MPGFFAHKPFVGEHLPCDLCGGQDAAVLARRDRRLRPLTNVLCARCGLIRQDPMPTEAELAAYYARDYRLDYKGAEEPRAQEIARSAEGAARRLAIVAPYLAPGARILDVGSGTGSFVDLAQRHGFDARGIEPNEAYARWSAARFGIRVEPGTWESADFAPASFDLVTVNHVLEHLRSPTATLTRLHRWIAPGGRLYVAVPDMKNPAASPFQRFHTAHVHGFAHESLVMLARKTGFAVEPVAGLTATALLFTRLDAPADDWFLYPGHAREMAAFFRANSPLRFLLRPAAYRRLVHHLRAQIARR